MPEVYVSRNQRRAKALNKLINYAKADGILKSDMCEALGMCKSTFSGKQKDPGSFTLAEIWALMDFIHVPEEKRVEILK